MGTIEMMLAAIYVLLLGWVVGSAAASLGLHPAICMLLGAAGSAVVMIWGALTTD